MHEQSTEQINEEEKEIQEKPIKKEKRKKENIIKEDPEVIGYFSLEEKKKEKEKHYEIVNNVVQRVKKVREGIGITSRGYDVDDTLVVINNVDAGDAIALYKVAHYGEGGKSRFGLLFILMVTFTIIMAFVLIFWALKRNSAEDVVLPPSPLPVAMQVNTGSIIDTTGTGVKIEEKEEIITENQGLEMERLKMQTDFQLESLKIELQKRDLQIQNQSSIIEEKTNIYNTAKAEIESLKAEILQKNTIIEEYTKKDISKDSFFIELGKQIDDECKKSGSSACKDLYYNFINK